MYFVNRANTTTLQSRLMSCGIVEIYKKGSATHKMREQLWPVDDKNCFRAIRVLS